MEFSMQEYWSGLPFPSPGDLLDLGIKPRSPTLHVDSLPSEPPVKTKPMYTGYEIKIKVSKIKHQELLKYLAWFQEISIPNINFYLFTTS